MRWKANNMCGSLWPRSEGCWAPTDPALVTTDLTLFSGSLTVEIKANPRTELSVLRNTHV